LDGADTAVYIKGFVGAWNGTTTTPELYLFSDCQSLVANLKSVNIHIAEKRLIIDLTALKEMIASKDLNDVTWIPTEIQLADALTKVMDSQALVQAIKAGIFPTMTKTTKRVMNKARPTPAQVMMAGFMNLLLG
jgi:hypothetical protein